MLAGNASAEPGVPRLVRDINTLASSAYPHSFADVDGTLFFASRHTLWKTDGTEAGTVLVKAGFDASPEELMNFGGTLFFLGVTRDPDGFAEHVDLWKSDGTDAGTVLVKRFPVSIDGAPLLREVAGSLYLAFYGDSASANRVWTTDGTEAGTILRDGMGSVPAEFNGGLFFVGNDNLLWRRETLDGESTLVKDVETEAGTFLASETAP